MWVGLFLFALDRFPLLEHGAGITHVARSKHMRVSPHQFVRNFPDDLIDIEAPCFAGDLRMHDYQQQKIAQFLAKMCVIFRARGLRHFVSFFK